MLWAELLVVAAGLSLAAPGAAEEAEPSASMQAPFDAASTAPVIEAGDAPLTEGDAAGDAAAPAEEDVEAGPPPSYDLPTDDPVAADLARQRLATLIPAELEREFGLLLYVNKAAEGALSQQMLVFQEDGAGDYALVKRWLVSTGRERREGYFTTTPDGLFKLDPHRFFKVHFSRRWNGVKMPWAMFFDYGYRTERSGLAIHGANNTTMKELGHRASGGCIRLAPAYAEELFTWIQRDFRGRVPVFAFDDVAGHTDRTGRLARDAAGGVRYAEGFRVLLVVDGEIVAAPPSVSEAEPVPDLALSVAPASVP